MTTDDDTPSRRVFFHIGALKTGSTHVQSLLWLNRRRLLSDGVFLPGENQRDHFDIGEDIRGDRSVGGRGPGPWTGTFEGALRAFDESGCHTAIISDERLARTRSAAIEQAMSRVDRTIDGAEVHIVYALRDFAGLVPSHWQEDVKVGGTMSLEEFLVRIRDDRGPQKFFWRAHDVPAVVDRWSGEAGRAVHLVTLPTTGPSDELWNRFAGIVGWSTSTSTEADRANTSLGLVEIDLLHRIQTTRSRGTPNPERQAILKHRVGNTILRARPNAIPIRIPEHHREWIDAENDRRVEFVKSTEHEVVGTIDDLVNEDRRFGTQSIAGHEAEQVDAAVDVVVSLADQLAAAERRIDELERERWTLRLRRRLRNGVARAVRHSPQAVQGALRRFAER